MPFKDFFINEIRSRLQKTSVLVVYDPVRRYRELCMSIATDKIVVVDAGESSIESRETALSTLQTLGESGSPLTGLLIYVPAAKPLDDEAKQIDPFALYAACGAVFPDGDGDEYLELCLKFKADHPTEIRRIFAENPNPDFAVIDAVGAGSSWPQLQAILKVESARDILYALLAPSEAQQKALRKTPSWVNEAKALFEIVLGLKLLSRAKSWEPIAEELWRFLLFSEFAFDLPVDLPVKLSRIRKAPVAAEPLVNGLCEQLRRDERAQDTYIEWAESIERDLKLPEACQAIDNLGVRDTFPFEERTFFAHAVAALQKDDPGAIRAILDKHADSVWVKRGENQTRWQLLQSAVQLVKACADTTELLPEYARNQGTLLDFYTSRLRDVDRLQREFEQIAGDIFDRDESIETVIQQTRAAYHRVSNTAHDLFIRHLEKEGWPPENRLANTDVFDRLVAPKLQTSGQRIAFFLIDALRYELGVELYKQLSNDGQIELQAAYAPLPSVTPVGMAGLLPGAGENLFLSRKNNKITPMLGDVSLPTVTQRLDLLRQHYGQRFGELSLLSFSRGKETIPLEVDLLVLRSNELDQEFESNPEAALGSVSRTFQQIQAAVRRLSKAGFREIVIATDHGFYLNADLQAGDVCQKPSGDWVSIHDRLLLGDGSSDGGNFVLPVAHLGIRSDFNQVAGPRALVAYRSGQNYFHGGASLQETVVPVIGLRLETAQTPSVQAPIVEIKYRRNKTRITSLLPVFEVSVIGGDLFSSAKGFEILLEAQDKEGNVVGEVQLGQEAVNSATQTVTLYPGNPAKITLKMQHDFEGPFTVIALAPDTLSTFSRLEMETDYMV